MTNLKSDPEARDAFSSILFRSSYYALTAYFLVLILEKLVMFIAAAIYGYQINFDYEYLKVKGDYSAWNQESVLFIYFFPYLIFAVIIVLLHLQNQKHDLKKPEFKHIFLQWVIFFLAYRLIGILPAHLYSYTGIYHAFSWLYIGTLSSIFIGIFSIVFFFLGGIWLLNRIFIMNARMNNSLNIIGLPLLLMSAFVIPVTICCGVAVLFFLPGLPKEEILGLTFIALPVIFTFFRLIYIKPELPTSKYYVEEIFNQWHIFLIVFILIVILRVGLIFGIRMG